MKKINSLFVYGVLVMAFISIYSCGGQSKATTTVSTDTKQQAVNYEKEGYVPATVIRYTVDGCQYLLQLRSGKKLEAQNLATELKQDKMEVWIKYEAVKNGTSICMAGDIVKITDYKVVK